MIENDHQLKITEGHLSEFKEHLVKLEPEKDTLVGKLMYESVLSQIETLKSEIEEYNSKPCESTEEIKLRFLRKEGSLFESVSVEDHTDGYLELTVQIDDRDKNESDITSFVESIIKRSEDDFTIKDYDTFPNGWSAWTVKIYKGDLID